MTSCPSFSQFCPFFMVDSQRFVMDIFLGPGMQEIYLHLLAGLLVPTLNYSNRYCLLWRHHHSTLLKEITEANPQGAPWCQTTASPAPAPGAPSTGKVIPAVATAATAPAQGRWHSPIPSSLRDSSGTDCHLCDNVTPHLALPQHSFSKSLLTLQTQTDFGWPEVYSQLIHQVCQSSTK